MRLRSYAGMSFQRVTLLWVRRYLTVDCWRVRGMDMKCGLYVRVSTNKQETENQLGQLRDFAASVGWRIVVEYVGPAYGQEF
jgi:resolvase-like protein